MQLSELKRFAPLLVVVAIVLSFLAGMHFAPEPEIQYRVETVTKTEWKERIVEVEKKVEVIKEVRVRDEVVKWKERIVEVAAPDGTVTKTTERVVDTATTDTSKKDAVGTTEKASTKEVEAEVKKDERMEFVQTPYQPKWHVTATAGLDVPSLLTNPATSGIFGAGVERRLLGPFWLGASVNTAGQGALVVGFEF